MRKAEETGLEGELKGLLYEKGASAAAFADLGHLPGGPPRGMNRAVSLAVALDRDILAGIHDGPTRPYFREYERVNERIDGLCRLAAARLEGAGYRAIPLFPTTENWDRETLAADFPHKTAATRAGLGWIGKSDLLITERFGAAIRLGTVLTDAPLEPAEPVDVSRCGRCRACVDRCPAGAIQGPDWQKGVPREVLYRAASCAETARRFSDALAIPATICGICIVACPWTQKYMKGGPHPGEAENPEKPL